MQVDDPESLSPAERFRLHTSLRGVCPARQGTYWSLDVSLMAVLSQYLCTSLGSATPASLSAICVCTDFVWSGVAMSWHDHACLHPCLQHHSLRFLLLCRYQMSTQGQCSQFFWICQAYSFSPPTLCWCYSGQRYTTRSVLLSSEASIQLLSLHDVKWAFSM